MATALKLRSDIKKLKKGLETKGVSASLKEKFKSQLQKAENELKSLKKTGKAPKKSSVAGTKVALTALQKLIQRKKYGVYQGAGVDLKKDAGEGAFATGRRTSKGLKSNQYGDAKSNKGNTYYEYRPNRLDVKQPKKQQTYPKLADGGMMDKGGMTFYVGQSIIYPNFIDKKMDKSVRDIHNKFANKELVIDKIKIDKPFNTAKVFNRSSGEKAPFDLILDSKFVEQYEDGGMMARGGVIDYSKQTSDDFKLGEIVWDISNKRYGTVIGIYDQYASDKYEVRLDSDGMQGTEDLRKVGSEGDKGKKQQLDDAINSYERLIKSYPKNNYPKQIAPKMADGGMMADNSIMENGGIMSKKHRLSK